MQRNPIPVQKELVPVALPECPPQVDQNLTLIANPDNCSAYYECDNGVPVPLGCPEGLYFCSEKDTCTWIWEPGCIFDCIVVKKETPVEVYNADDTVNAIDHKNEIFGTKGRRVPSEKYFHKN